MSDDAFLTSAAVGGTQSARPPGALRICWTFFRFTLRRWRALLGVGATVVAESVLNIIKPWPRAILVNVLTGHALTGWQQDAFHTLPGGVSQAALLNVAVVAMALVFV